MQCSQQLERKGFLPLNGHPWLFPGRHKVWGLTKSPHRLLNLCWGFLVSHTSSLCLLQTAHFLPLHLCECKIQNHEGREALPNGVVLPIYGIPWEEPYLAALIGNCIYFINRFTAQPPHHPCQLDQIASELGGRSCLIHNNFPIWGKKKYHPKQRACVSEDPRLLWAACVRPGCSSHLHWPVACLFPDACLMEPPPARSSLLFSTAGLHTFQLPPQPTQGFQRNEHRINHCVLCEETHRQLGLAAALHGSSQRLGRLEVPQGHLCLRSPSPTALVPPASFQSRTTFLERN